MNAPLIPVKDNETIFRDVKSRAIVAGLEEYQKYKERINNQKNLENRLSMMEDKLSKLEALLTTLINKT